MVKSEIRKSTKGGKFTILEFKKIGQFMKGCDRDMTSTRKSTTGQEN